jgi:hypothetical protein
MLTSLSLLLLIGIASGISGAIYRFVLNQEPVLNFWFRFGDKYEGKWFYPPIWGCIAIYIAIRLKKIIESTDY